MPRIPQPRLLRLATLPIALLGVACVPDDGGGAPEAIRLVDRFDTVTIKGTAQELGDYERTEWKFGSAAGAGSDGASWQAAGGTRGLRVEGETLVASSAGPSPLLHLAWEPSERQQDDQIQSVEVRLRASAGTSVSFAALRDEEPELGPLLAPDNPFGFAMTSPIVPGGEMTTYALRPVQPIRAEGVRHLVLRPVDTAGAEFAIESIRVVFEREHLAGIPSGVNWQGLAGVFRESLVSRSPESLRFDLDLPSDALLDLAIGTLEPGAVTFEIEVAPRAGGDPIAVRRTVTTPGRWQELTLPLDELSRRPVTVALTLSAARDGMLGLWGAPAVRRRVDGLDDRPQAVIAILMDTLRRDHLDLYGHDRETAPTLSRLAAEGLLVEDAISQATWTKVSVPSIFTSLYPTSHTVASIPDLLPASADTMAEIFRRAGYATFGLSAIPFTGKMTNLHQGYEVLSERSMEIIGRGVGGDKTARHHVDMLLPWLESHRDVPFFAFLHVEDPHAPYYAPPPYATIWGEAGGSERYRDMQEQVRPRIHNPLMRIFGMARQDELEAAGVDTEAYVRLELDAYDGLIRSMDDEIRRLVERIDELGLRDKVVLAFISDHGTEFLEHGAHFHGQSVYGELNQVPMFFWGPGFVPAGTRVPVTVENMDYMPTVLELAGLEVPEAAQGQSLLPWFTAAGSESAAAKAGWRKKPAVTELLFDAADPASYTARAILVDGWKLVRRVEGSGTVELELYDHRNDPLDLSNVAAEHPDKVEQLNSQLENWQKFAEAHKLSSDADLAANLSPEELERLRSLGYL